MQRWCSKLRSLPLSLSPPSLLKPSHPLLCRIRLLHSPPSQTALHFSPLISPNFKTLANTSFTSSAARMVSGHGLTSVGVVQVRSFSAKSKEKKWKKISPTVSKVKKIKMKFYSSYKRRFRVMKDGQIRRWREGKQHNAHLKTKEAKRRLRRPSTVPVAYAKVMKKLSFC